MIAGRRAKFTAGVRYASCERPEDILRVLDLGLQRLERYPEVAPPRRRPCTGQILHCVQIPTLCPVRLHIRLSTSSSARHHAHQALTSGLQLLEFSYHERVRMHQTPNENFRNVLNIQNASKGISLRSDIPFICLFYLFICLFDTCFYIAGPPAGGYIKIKHEI